MLSKAASQATNEKTDTKHTRTVVLVHGIYDSGARMGQMADYLRKEGFTVYTPSLSPNTGKADIDELARQLSAYIDRNIPRGEKFDLVGFSMGGLVCRYYLQRMDGLRRADRFITLGAPHHGSALAYMVNNPGCRQMRPDSAFIRNLNSDIGVLKKVHFTSIWSPLDLSIIPSNSSRTDASRNIAVWVPIHPLLVWSPLPIRTVAGLLKS